MAEPDRFRLKVPGQPNLNAAPVPEDLPGLPAIPPLDPFDGTPLAPSGKQSFELLTANRARRLSLNIYDRLLPNSLRNTTEIYGSKALQTAAMQIFTAPAVNESFPWDKMSVDCKRDVRAAIANPENEVALAWYQAPCGKDNLAGEERFSKTGEDREGASDLRRASHAANARVAKFKSEMEKRDLLVKVFNLLSLEIFSQAQEQKQLLAEAPSEKECEQVTEDKLARCLFYDAKKRETTLRFIGNIQILLDVFQSVPVSYRDKVFSDTLASLKTDRVELEQILWESLDRDGLHGGITK